jgi:hypothetical protein
MLSLPYAWLFLRLRLSAKPTIRRTKIAINAAHNSRDEIPGFGGILMDRSRPPEREALGYRLEMLSVGL